MSAQAIQRVEETALPALSEAAAIIQVIERAAANPNVDIEKMERLLDMHERVKARNAKTAYAAALAELQPRLPTVSKRGMITVPAKDGKPGHETPFARWEDINEAIRPVLAEYGFALSFRMGLAQDGKVMITGILSHREGHQEETTITLVHDATGSKNAVQAVGSTVSYGKRYTAMALLNITTGGEDDDGHMAPGGFVSDEQAATIQALIVEVGADPRRFLAHMKAESVAAISAKHYDAAVAALKAKARANG